VTFLEVLTTDELNYKFYNLPFCDIDVNVLYLILCRMTLPSVVITSFRG